MASPIAGGFKRGDRVRSLVSGANWKPRALEVGAEGVVTGPAAPPQELTVDFGGEPRLTGKVKAAEVCKPEDYEQRMASPIAGGFKRGDRVRSLVSGANWKPRALEVGAEGVVTGPAAPPHELTVDFGGEPRLTGKVKAASVCKPEDYEQRMASPIAEPGEAAPGEDRAEPAARVMAGGLDAYETAAEALQSPEARRELLTAILENALETFQSPEALRELADNRDRVEQIVDHPATATEAVRQITAAIENPAMIPQIVQEIAAALDNPEMLAQMLDEPQVAGMLAAVARQADAAAAGEDGGRRRSTRRLRGPEVRAWLSALPSEWPVASSY